jgi:hypothetical protein
MRSTDTWENCSCERGSVEPMRSPYAMSGKVAVKNTAAVCG